MSARTNSFLFAAVSCFAITAFFSCAGETRKTISIDRDFYGKAIPAPPEGYTIEWREGDAGDANESAPDLRISALTVSDSGAVTASAPRDSRSRASRIMLVARDYLVPIAREGAPKGATGSLKPLSRLAPNEWALPLKGRRIGESGYPVSGLVCARCDFRSTRPEPRLEAWLRAAFPAPRPDKVAYVCAVGDLMPARGVEKVLRSAPDARGKTGIERTFTDTLPILRSGDVTIGNLEGAVTSGTAKATKSYTFKYKPDILRYLKDAGFTYIMLTNNHSFDYGAEGFADTLEEIARSGLGTSGCGTNLAEASRFWRTNIAGERISVLSCGAYPVEKTGFDGKKTAAALESRAGILWESPAIAELVRAEKATGAYVIVNVHGGEEYRTSPSARQMAFYRSLADAGADAVFGSHPHVLQPIEYANGKVIAYSLGNFLFPGMQGMRGAEKSEIVRLGIFHGRAIYRDVFPARLSGLTVSLAK